MHGGAGQPWITLAGRRARLTVLVAVAGVALGALMFAVAGARAKAPSSTPPSAPALGDWEATGPGGVPLSFALTRGPGGVNVSALAVGYPGGCPVGPSHTLAAPVEQLHYAFSNAPSPGSVVISGTAAGGRLDLRGQLNSSRSATFSATTINPQLPCPWPKTLTWHAHPAHRRSVPDAVWNAEVVGLGLSGTVIVRTGAGGRVVSSLRGHYRCMDSHGTGQSDFASAPVNVFVSPAGRFTSAASPGKAPTPGPLSGAFGAHGELHGTLLDQSPCTNREMVISFRAAGPLRRR